MFLNFDTMIAIVIGNVFMNDLDWFVVFNVFFNIYIIRLKRPFNTSKLGPVMCLVINLDDLKDTFQ